MHIWYLEVSCRTKPIFILQVYTVVNLNFGLPCLVLFRRCFSLLVFSLFWGQLDKEMLCLNQETSLDVCNSAQAPHQSAELSGFPALQALVWSWKSAFNSSDSFMTLEYNSISHKYISLSYPEAPPPDFAVICAGIHYYISVLCLFSSEAIMCIILNCPVSYLNDPSKWNEIPLLIWLYFSFPGWLVYMSLVASFLYAARIITLSSFSKMPTLISSSKCWYDTCLCSKSLPYSDHPFEISLMLNKISLCKFQCEILLILKL